MIIKTINRMCKPVTAAICIACIMAASVFGTAANASDENSAVLEVSGVLSCGHSAKIGIRVYAPDKDAEDLRRESLGGDILSVMPYQNQGVSDNDGGYNFSVEIKDGKSGVYSAYIGCFECGNTDKQEVLYSNEREAQGAFELLKQAVSNSDEQRTIEVYKQYRYALGFVSNADEMSDEAVREKLLYSYLKGAIEDYTYQTVRYVYSAAAITAARANAKFKSLFDYAGELALDKTEIGKFLSESFVSDKLKADMSARFSGHSDKDLSDMKNFKNRIKEDFILSTVRYPDGFGNTIKVLDEFKSYIGYKKLSSDCAASISGRDFETISALKDAVDGYKQSGGNGGGGGGSSSGMSNKISKDNISPTEEIQTIDENIFDDIDDISWAKESIISLAQLKIINGRGDYKFCPNESITREEAVKILVCAFCSDSPEVDVPFADVNADEWYAPFVKAAYGKGIARGISENEFGIGESISRQDLAVLCANILRLEDSTIKAADDTALFDDDGDIADYAKDSVCLLKSLGIVNGNENGKFEPKSDITRAEAAKMIYGLYKYIA